MSIDNRGHHPNDVNFMSDVHNVKCSPSSSSQVCWFLISGLPAFILFDSIWWHFVLFLFLIFLIKTRSDFIWIQLKLYWRTPERSFVLIAGTKKEVVLHLAYRRDHLQLQITNPTTQPSLVRFHFGSTCIKENRPTGAWLSGGNPCPIVPCAYVCLVCPCVAFQMVVSLS